MIGGKDDAAAIERKGGMVGGVSRCMQGGQRPAVTGKALPIAKCDIGYKSHVGAFGKGIGFTRMQRPGGAVRSFRHRQRPGRLLQPPGKR
ncbi:hypothetical protein D3C80_989120 [compost metagenome]